MYYLQTLPVLLNPRNSIMLNDLLKCLIERKTNVLILIHAGDWTEPVVFIPLIFKNTVITVWLVSHNKKCFCLKKITADYIIYNRNNAKQIILFWSSYKDVLKCFWPFTIINKQHANINHNSSISWFCN